MPALTDLTKKSVRTAMSVSRATQALRQARTNPRDRHLVDTSVAEALESIEQWANAIVEVLKEPASVGPLEYVVIPRLTVSYTQVRVGADLHAGEDFDLVYSALQYQDWAGANQTAFVAQNASGVTKKFRSGIMTKT